MMMDGVVEGAGGRGRVRKPISMILHALRSGLRSAVLLQYACVFFGSRFGFSIFAPISTTTILACLIRRWDC